MSIANAIRQMLAAGLTIEQALIAAEAMEANVVSADPALTKRQARNKRYYETHKAPEKRLKASETSETVSIKTVPSETVLKPSEPADAGPSPRARVVNTSTFSDEKVIQEKIPLISNEISPPKRKNAPRKPLPEGWPPDAFDQWWEFYPRKTDKKSAEAAFERVAKTGRISFDVLLARTKDYGFNLAEPQFIPHPTTWLNKERFNDEPEPHPVASQGQGPRQGSARQSGSSVAASAFAAFAADQIRQSAMGDSGGADGGRVARFEDYRSPARDRP